MGDLFVSYEQAVKLKELGFDPFLREDCLAYFNTSNSNNDLETKDWWLLRNNDFQYALSAPLKSQVFKWFRENHNLDYNIINWSNCLENWCFRIMNLVMDENSNLDFDSYIVEENNSSYEDAELACIDNLIGLVTDGKI
jgi:hypothetical protein